MRPRRLAEDRKEEQVAEDVVPARMEEHRREPADRPRLRRVARVLDVAGVERRVADGGVEVGKLYRIQTARFAAISATVTIGNRRARIPSESGSISRS